MAAILILVCVLCVIWIGGCLVADATRLTAKGVAKGVKKIQKDS